MRTKGFFTVLVISAFVWSMILKPVNGQAAPDVRSWIASHKNASPKEIDSFVTNEIIEKLSNIEEVYSALDTLIHAFPISSIPTSVYVSYAQKAELRFDFEKALEMYVHAYRATKDVQYIIRASIHALETGNIKGAFSYLPQMNDVTVSDSQRVFASIMKARVLEQDQQSDMALALLQTLPFMVNKKNLTSNFYYTLYHIAQRNGKNAEANLAHQVLTEQYPYSIEVYMLNSPHVQPLPLPSKILGSVTGDLHNRLNSSTNSEFERTQQEDISLPVIPKTGYQVAAFTMLENAENALEYYHDIWYSVNIDGVRKPIIIQKDVFGTRFYQIIFPLDEFTVATEKEKERVLQNLREHNIEGGFVITNDFTE